MLKISSISGVVNRIGNVVDKNTLKSIYYAHVNSHLSYMAPICGFAATEALLNALQVAQNQSLRSLFRVYYYANGLSTEEIRKNIQCNTAILAYFIKNNIIKTNIQLNLINQVHAYPTRSATNIYHQSFRTNSGKHLTTRVVAIEYNKLPTNIQLNIKNCQSIQKLKKHVKFYILTT